MTPSDACKICGGPSDHIGSKRGTFHKQVFHFRHCAKCGFRFVSNPITEYEAIYTAEYFAGRGADPWVDYAFELAQPEKTVRVYEWAGILDVIRALKRVGGETRWLDYSCGNGGLVRYVRQHQRCEIAGYEEGPIAGEARRLGIPVWTRDEMEAAAGTCDIVTAIEVLEHISEPLAPLREIRRLLKPGGLFFATTGNAAPQQDRFLEWRYVYPEVHVSFFEPRTLALALQMTGFEPRFAGYLPGFTGIIRFKALKSLGIRQRALWERCLPWRALARVTDWRLQISRHPAGWAR